MTDQSTIRARFEEWFGKQKTPGPIEIDIKTGQYDSVYTQMRYDDWLGGYKAAHESQQSLIKRYEEALNEIYCKTLDFKIEDIAKTALNGDKS